jgi:hypothetical protein
MPAPAAAEAPGKLEFDDAARPPSPVHRVPSTTIPPRLRTIHAQTLRAVETVRKVFHC